jgi:hypothetical protein
MVGHRGHGQLQPRPFAHLTRIGAACIDHMFAADRAFFGLDNPFTLICSCVMFVARQWR